MGVIILRERNIDSLKGLSIIGVVILHFSFNHSLGDVTAAMIEDIKYAFYWSVLSFFFCSGYLYSNKNKSIEFLIDFSKKKFFSLLIPYLIFCTFYGVSFFVLGKLGSVDFWTYYIYPVAPQLYFLVFLFGISVSYCIFDVFLGKYSLYLFCFFSLCLFVNAGYESVPYGRNFNLIYLYSFIYSIGALIKRIEAEKRNYDFIFFLLLLTLIILSGYYYATSIILLLLLYLMIKIINSLGFCIPALPYVGKFSSSIYIWHAPLVMPLLFFVFTDKYDFSLIMFVPYVFFVIMSCIFIGKFVHKFEIFKILRF
ncbi:acyltransferase family protein [Vibrio sp. E150_011]